MAIVRRSASCCEECGRWKFILWSGYAEVYLTDANPAVGIHASAADSFAKDSLVFIRKGFFRQSYYKRSIHASLHGTGHICACLHPDLLGPKTVEIKLVVKLPIGKGHLPEQIRGTQY